MLNEHLVHLAVIFKVQAHLYGKQARKAHRDPWSRDNFTGEVKLRPIGMKSWTSVWSAFMAILVTL